MCHFEPMIFISDRDVSNSIDMGSTILCGRAFVGISRLSSWKKPFAKCRTFATKIEVPPATGATPRVERTPTMEELKEELNKEGIEISTTPYVRFLEDLFDSRLGS